MKRTILPHTGLKRSVWGRPNPAKGREKMTMPSKIKNIVAENALFCAEMVLLFIVAQLAPWLTALHKRRMTRMRVKIREGYSGKL
ncbi:MAG: hypothetical protein JXA50_06010 [Deltaproteobacteria bacterium]|nr:hypothetical protein [Deltaproteobacteria bacterium]